MSDYLHNVHNHFNPMFNLDLVHNTFVKSVSQPENVYQSLSGTSGAVALPHASTGSTFNQLQFQSTNVTLYHHFAYTFTTPFSSAISANIIKFESRVHISKSYCSVPFSLYQPRKFAQSLCVVYHGKYAFHQAGIACD